MKTFGLLTFQGLLLAGAPTQRGAESSSRTYLRKNKGDDSRVLGQIVGPTLGSPAVVTVPAFGGGAISDIVESEKPTTEEAEYQVTFENLWTADNHTPNFPGNAHWSAPVGSTHGCSYTMWQAGELASEGVVRVAEVGSTSILRTELASERNNGNVLDIFQGSNQFNLDTDPTQTFRVTVDSQNSLISLVTMIAPSPDWFAGVHDLNPSSNETWWETFTVDLNPYDAGSDGGDTYNARNDSLDPPVPISRITDSSNPSTMVFVKDGEVLPVARLSFQLLSR